MIHDIMQADNVQSACYMSMHACTAATTIYIFMLDHSYSQPELI